MNEVETEAPRVDLEEEARLVGGVLREYAAKLTEFNADVLSFVETAYEVGEHHYRRVAWLLDRFGMINRPLQRVLSRGSGLFEHAALPPRVRDELDLRLRELESQLYHAERMSLELAGMLSGKQAQKVAELRYAAGLPADRSSAAKRA